MGAPHIARVLRLIGTLVFIAITAGASAHFARKAWPEAWRMWVRRAFVGGFGVMGLGWIAWAVGKTAEVPDLYRGGLMVVAALLASSALLFVTSFVWAPSSLLLKPSNDDTTLRESRRAILTRAMGVVPVASAGAGPIGATAALLEPKLKIVDLEVDGLPQKWDELRILQLSDVHLGTFVDVEQIMRALELARPHRPDLIVLTGDIADDYSKLPETLEAVEKMGAPLGALAVLGNHEMFRGRSAAIEIYGRSQVKLLIDEGVMLERNGAKIWVGGADDPATLGREHRPFLERTVRRAMEKCPNDADLRVLLSHRPEGFETAVQLGVHVTLAGHTHGSQIALFGRSIFEALLPKSYLLGTYKEGRSHLYTTAGLGHWFPFRLNCPPEAALIRIRRLG